MQKNEWHSWRQQGIGSSDAPVIMGVSPWSTPFKLWEEKTGLVTRDASNWATQRGNDLEPKARAMYELEFGIDMPATLAVHKDHSFLRASLDGFNADENLVLEIKCPGAADHASAMSGVVPTKYFPQLQHQLLVTGAKAVHYYSFDGEMGVRVVVEPDVEYCKKLFDEERKFWKCVTDKTPPELIGRDFKKIRDAELARLLEEYFTAQSTAKSWSDEVDRIKTQILEHESLKEHARIICGDGKITKVVRQGSVNYKSIPELKSIDLEKFRGKSSSYFTIAKVVDKSEGIE